MILGGPVSTGGGAGLEKSKEWQMELLMEKLRSKASTFKSLVETAKNLRMAMLVIYDFILIPINIPLLVLLLISRIFCVGQEIFT